MPDRTQPPVIHHAVEFDLQLPEVETFYLSNGVPVLAYNAGEEAVLSLELVWAAGNRYEPRNLVARAANHLMRNGTSSRTAFDIAEQVDFYGAFLGSSARSESASLQLHTLSKHLPALLPVLVDLVTDSTYPQEELDIFIQNARQSLSVNLRKCDFVADREIDALLYGFDHPYGRYTRFEDFDALNRDELLAFYDQHYRKGSAVIFVSGRLPEDIRDQLDAAFGQMPWTAYKPHPEAGADEWPLPAGERSVRITNDPNGVQGAIRLARRMPGRLHPDFHSLQVLNAIFGGFFGSRLMSNIREDKGYTYGIYSFLQPNLGPSGWAVSTEAGRNVCEACIKEVYHEMERLRTGFIGDEELLLVRNYLLGKVLGSLDGPFQVMNRWRGYFLGGIADGRRYFNDAVETTRTVPASELQRLAGEYLRPEAFYELVVV